MSKSVAEKRAAFRKLHEQGCFMLPNPWDVGSAKLLASLGFSALASSSAGYAWTLGHPDHVVEHDSLLAHLTALCESVDLPINADYESGFASEPEGVAANVRLAIETGIAGLSIEDLDEDGRLFETALAVERIKAARQAIDASGEDVILVARTEGMLDDPDALGPAIDKLTAFAEAGADCLFAPGVKKRSDIKTMVAAVAPKPLNVLVLDPTQTLDELAGIGVRRLSVGGSLARVAWGAVVKAAEGFQAGSFAGLADGAPRDLLNGVFGKG